MTPDITAFLMFLALLQEQGRGGPQSGPPGPPGPSADPGVAPVTPAPAVPTAAPVTPSPATPAHPSTPVAPTPAPVTPAPAVPPGTLPPMPPWPTPPTPGTLPPFPGAGWCPDTPVTPAVQARATYWNNLLWNMATKTIVKPYVQEMVGGQWVTFAAAWHPGDKGAQTYMACEAWRVCTAPPVAPSVPAATPVHAAALAMNSALVGRGYKQADQGLYMAFQREAGLGADGFPGTHTMGALGAALQDAGVPMAPVHIYPWLSKPGTTGYDGVNAPTLAEWLGTAPGAVQPSPSPSPAPAPSPSPAPAPALPAVQAAAVAMNDALGAHGYKQADQGLYRAFQKAAGLGADGFPGTHTMNALAQTLHDMGLIIAPVTVYPWSSSRGYDGVNAPTMAEWTGA